MTLGEKQELFVLKQAEWVLWVLSHPGWTLRDGEGRILRDGPDGKGRKAKKLGMTILVQDAVHMDGGTHYLGIGKDWNLFVDGVFITSGHHPAWQACGEKWESMHPSCRWGGRFGDANHTSFEHGGVA